MVSKFLNIDTDGTLSGNSDTTVASQKAVKTYIDGKVNDATITITQGGVPKGIFTVNQSTNQTVELSAPSSADVSYVAETETLVFN
ncbi:MAG: hypothetical protein IKP06_05565 [Elusimicrobiaceae bacterium]|nr:hypothetical protein [Elusimicrobiaceae bacterium]